MDETPDEEIEYIIFSLGIYCKGSVTLKELEEMPLPKVLRYNEYADRVYREIKSEVDKQQRSK